MNEEELEQLEYNIFQYESENGLTYIKVDENGD